MPEYIEREEAIAKVEPDEYYHSNEVKAMLEDIPAIDAVLVVRCKDCSYCDGFWGPFIEPNEIGICEINMMAAKPNDFCSYGERRDDNAVD